MLGNSASADLAIPSESTSRGLSGAAGASLASVSPEASSAEDWWRLLALERPAQPLPLCGIDLSGHEVTPRVVSELAECARKLGPDCRIGVVRFAQCRLEMGLPGDSCSPRPLP